MWKHKEIMGFLCVWVPLILCCARVVSAAGFAGGAGKSNDPYQIRTAEQLTLIGSDPNLLDKYFILVNDIDLDPNHLGNRVFPRAVIAPDTNDASDLFQGVPFTGRLDGKGHIVRNLAIQGDRRAFLGLFGSIGRGGRVRDLHMKDALIVGTGSCRYLGVLAGYIEGCTVVNCSVTGRVAGGISARSLGGLVGFVWFDGRVMRCSASCDVVGGDHSAGLGGIAGDNGGEITHCYAVGTVSSGYGSSRIGGLVGLNTPRAFETKYSGAFSTGSVFQCYSAARVSGGPFSTGVGGLIGQEDDYYLRAVGSFWDTKASGLSSSAGGTGLSTAEMQDPNTYIAAGWDFVGERANGTADLWLLSKGSQYPILTTLSDAPPAHKLAGVGTAESPYVVATIEDLGAVCRYDESACYRLMNNIDLSGIVWSISPISIFNGQFDGAGFVISNLNVHGHSYLGLFDSLEPNSSVMNLRVVGGNIRGGNRSAKIGGLSGKNEGRVANCQANGSVAGGDCVGELVGLNGENGAIVDCHATGAVSGTSAGAEIAGGLVGINAGTITNSHASVELSGGEFYTLGGLVGSNGGDITACYAAGRINGNEPLGGLVGVNDGTVCDSYAAVGIDSKEETSAGAGGLVGVNRGKIVNSYSVSTVHNVFDKTMPGSGLIGRGWQSSMKGAVISSFWDKQATGITESMGGGIALTTTQMQTGATFINAGWDFDRVWMLSEGKDYPHLRWEKGNSAAAPRN